MIPPTHPEPLMTAPSNSKRTGQCGRVRVWIVKVGLFLAVALMLGWFYGWASPRVFPHDTRAGFGYGVLHGALMPMAFPSLVMGQNVEIYAANNSGRTYKLGYIAGINLCGLIFFGSVFWRPRPSERASQRNQFR